jgi:hypothetical protein
MQIETLVKARSMMSATAAENGHDPYEMADLSEAKSIHDILRMYYPGYWWSVEVESEHGIAKISLPNIMPENRKILLHLNRISDHNTKVRTVRRFAGELLERYNVPRSTVDFYAFMEAKHRQGFVNRNDPVPS